MKPTKRDIENSLANIQLLIDDIEENSIFEPSDSLKHSLAIQLAEAVTEIRRKYNLTSAFYVPAEQVADKIYKEKYEDY